MRFEDVNRELFYRWIPIEDECTENNLAGFIPYKLGDLPKFIYNELILKEDLRIFNSEENEFDLLVEFNNVNGEAELKNWQFFYFKDNQQVDMNLNEQDVIEYLRTLKLL